MKHLIVLPAVLVVAACADSGASYQPILDGPPSAAFQSDLAACQSLARNQKQFDQETLGAAVVGGGAGAVLGELDEDGDALSGAIVGAIAGGAAGAVNASERRESIVVECLRNRGHRVVG
ncbi:MAG: glycine zipper family protein [Pelagimonas sp.]|uniref:glycine zipper family protein n=1 Tax=Pelagimonas sp. TaxID=2073170 RepID=UPI003D6BD591